MDRDLFDGSSWTDVQLIPPNIDPGTPSEGEKHVFELFARDEAHPDWTVLHSQDIARHRRQMESEIDFLVVAPGLGVLVLEVKGCRRLKRERGLWYYGRDIEGHLRSPFKQASEAMHSVRERLVKRRPELSGVLFWSAACFPFIEFTDESEEWAPWQVIDKVRLGQRSIAGCVESVLGQAQRRVAELRQGWFDPDAREPTLDQCNAITQTLRPDFEFFESAKARGKRVDEAIRHYTEEQFEALDHMCRMPRVVFDGPAGTGKTLLALEAARRSHAVGKHVLFLCFNRPLSEWLRDQAQELLGASGALMVVVRTVHQHMTEIAGRSVRGSLQDGDGYWNQALPEAAAMRLLENADALQRAERENQVVAGVARRFGIFDELIVDEAQDVVRECYLDVLDLSLRGGLSSGTWRMFGDFTWQTIYDDVVSLEGFCSSHGGNCPQFSLDENCRNTPRVAQLACACGGVESGYRRILRPDDGVEPEIRLYAGVEDQQRQLAHVLQGLYESGFTGPQVAVLSTHGDSGAAAASLKEPPWHDRLEPLLDDKDGCSSVNLRGGKTRYSSIYRFKGLEARAVVLTDIEDLSTPHGRALAYVGATRATQRLVVLAHESLRGRIK